ncbi:PQQ-binding-like beta-propeller repeat protein [Nocardiopsis sp. NPDC006938]|uniref:outer membrane protein assembly factor BamB family protein n=1 Tax=Nocardiopsis sp. NPDC006938 TaxID=3364337 RepID=UPI003681E7D8
MATDGTGSPPPPRPRAPRGLAPGRVTGIAAIAALCVAVSACGAGDGPGDVAGSPEPLAGNTVEHRTTATSADARPVPTTVTEAAWVWEAPAGRTVRAVHPSATGAVMELDNGVVALDTSTGEETWSFLLPDHHSGHEDTDLSVSPDGSVVAFSPGRTMVLLDAASGQEIARLDHDASGPSQFTVTEAGLIGDHGRFTADADHRARVSMTPWGEGRQGWESTIPACEEGELGEVSQGVLTGDQVVVEFSCPFREPVTVGLDQTDGGELWRLAQGTDYSPDPDVFPVPSPSAEADFGVVGDLLVLQNIAAERGTVVIDTASGRVLGDDIPSTVEHPLLRVLPDGYLTVREGAEGDSEGRALTYELRDFDGSVRHRVVTSTEVARGSLNNFLVLEDALLKIRMVDAGEDQDMAVLGWDTDEHPRVPLPVDVDTTGIPSIARADREVGPSTFRAVPGAVVLREFPGGGDPHRVVGLR